MLRKRVLRNLGMKPWGFCTLAYDPRDCWIGVFWDRDATWLDVYVVLVPCFPLRWHFSGLRRWDKYGE